MRPGPSWRGGSPARTPCRRPTRSRYSWPGDHGRALMRDHLRRILDVRTRRPQAIAEAATARKRRAALLSDDDDQLFIIAADHPARGALRVGERPMAIANRADLLERMSLALCRPGVVGVLRTAAIFQGLRLCDVLDD